MTMMAQASMARSLRGFARGCGPRRARAREGETRRGGCRRWRALPVAGEILEGLVEEEEVPLQLGDVARIQGVRGSQAKGGGTVADSATRVRMISDATRPSLKKPGPARKAPDPAFSFHPPGTCIAGLPQGDEVYGGNRQQDARGDGRMEDEAGSAGRSRRHPQHEPLGQLAHDGDRSGRARGHFDEPVAALVPGQGAPGEAHGHREKEQQDARDPLQLVGPLVSPQMKTWERWSITRTTMALAPQKCRP